MTIRRAALVLVLSLWSAGLTAEEWPQFRGLSGGLGVDHRDLPDTWGPATNVAWVASVAGLGWSSPVVWGDHVFLTSVVSSVQQEAPKPGYYLGDWPASTAPHKWMIYDFDYRTGKLRWERQVSAVPPALPKHLKNSYASETPVTDGERIYAYFAGVGLFAFDFDGKPVWSIPLAPNKTRNNWGTGGSPAVYKGRVYLVSDNDAQSFIAAFDAKTGKQMWRVDRQEGTNWSTPYVWENAQRTEIVTTGSDLVRAYDLEGKQLWQLKGMSSITIPTPFTSHGMLFLSSGYIPEPLRPTYAIRPGASGDISLAPNETSNAYIAWSSPAIAPYNPSPVVAGDTLYTLLDRGFFTAHDARTGRELYGRQRITAEASGFTSSPWAYNGKVFVLSEDGDTFVIQAGPEFKVVGKNSLGEMTLATPAIARGSLFIRTASKLYRFTNAH
jgi:outer membrane protein assembly factor BamB